jgi:hypothetical protein
VEDWRIGSCLPASVDILFPLLRIYVRYIQAANDIFFPTGKAEILGADL